MYKLFVFAAVLVAAQAAILPGVYGPAYAAPYAPYGYAAGLHAYPYHAAAPYAHAPAVYAPAPYAHAPAAYAHPVPPTKVIAEAPVVEETLEGVEEHGYKIAF
ncbi:uncharacterized protein [Lepeophtheirus salmonis]|nr:splicing factor 3A subunit 2-like [Lepeophtheirus salmonis]